RRRDISMAQQLLNRWERHRRAVQPIRRRIEERLGKRMAEIVRTQRRSELRCLAELDNDLPDAAFRQRSALAKKEMPIWPPAPGSNRIPIDSCPLTPAFCQKFAMLEVGIKRFAYFLDQRDLAMFEPLATANDEQPAPHGDLNIGDLEGCDFRHAWA